MKSKSILVLLAILLWAGQAGAEKLPFTVTWQMMEAHSVPCPHFWIDDYGRRQYNSGCLVAHFEWSGPYTGNRQFDSLDEATAFVKKKQNNFGFPQRLYDFKISWDNGEIIFPNPELVGGLYEYKSGVTDLDSGVTVW